MIKYFYKTLLLTCLFISALSAHAQFTSLTVGADSGSNWTCKKVIMIPFLTPAPVDTYDYSYLWTFDDGTFDTLARPQKTFRNNGSNSYSLFVRNKSNNDTISVSNNVNYPYADRDSVTIEFLSHSGCNTCNGVLAVSRLGGPSGAHNFRISKDTANILVSTDSLVTGLCPGKYLVLISGPGGICVNQTSVVEILDSCAQAEGVVFEDINGNGVQNVGDLPIAGALVRAVGPAGTFEDYTNSSGEYDLNIPGLGNYTISTPASFFPTPCLSGGFATGNITSPGGAGSYSLSFTFGNKSETGRDFAIEPPAPVCGLISGIVYDDLDGNGSQNGGELGLSNINIIVSGTSDTFQTLSRADGSWSVSAPLPGNYTISMSLVANVGFCQTPWISHAQTDPAANGTHSANLTLGTPNDAGNDFGLLVNPGSDNSVDAICAYFGVNAGEAFKVWLDAQQLGNITDTCILRLQFDPLVKFNSATLTPSANGSDFIEWTFLPPSSSINDIHITLDMELDSSTVLGHLLDWEAYWICPGDTDNCPLNDSIARTVVTQFGPAKRPEEITGPNTLQVFHSGNAASGVMDPSDNSLSFAINLQNDAGIGDSVFHVIMRDSFSSFIDINTISVGNTNAEFDFQINKDGIALWEADVSFNDVSDQQLGSYAYLEFNCNVLNSTPPGAQIHNAVEIIFNFGASQSSNKVTTSRSAPSAIELLDNEQPSLQVWPNPAESNIHINTKDGQDGIIRILDMLGRILYRSDIASGAILELSIDEFQTGIYLIHLEKSDGYEMQRIRVK